ncbi:ComEA family DNA-binding protein [Limobrevibacterium gyesilva]|uniref:Helix-hairpin-helix domain-containing protein n=1 Tax=Limobrevibacterium gyesilva TaxID=2991712 RepID=A0AA41YJ27_9PROT|nr:helix-hairpin-helix domain-containing protein [Limobrevibacterium gyesilva]MCW3474069.1 helix-hairpin-helix domain-containing protein [Limobrevibacterium gyesilva]
MFARRFVIAAAILAVSAMPALAQGTGAAPKPAAPAATAPPMAHPATPAPAAAAKKVDLNTATAAELDALPDVGKARSKAILDERAKGKFKDWADFDHRMTGTSVNAGVKAKIKDHVTF